MTHRRGLAGGFRAVLLASAAFAGWAAPVRAGDTASPAPTAAPSGVEQIRADAEAVAKLVQSDLAKRYLAATAQLPHVEPRVIYRDKDRTKAYSTAAYAKLAPDEQSALQRRDCDELFYYQTGYGSPVMYARPLDLLAARGITDLAGKRVLDFGYGSMGNPRLMALCGADFVGVDVEPVLAALYDQPEDQGPVPAKEGPAGKVTLAAGQFPADEAVKAKVGGSFDLFVSKNTLKRGYVHPERPANERQLVHLGVDDAAFVQAMFEILKPGGLAMIYNICPAQAPADKPYIPWADGRCPFERALLEKAGFEVLEFDKDDTAAALDWFMALGFDDGKGREALSADLFAHYTLLRRPAK